MQHGRLTWLSAEDLEPEQRTLYDAILGSPRAQDPADLPLGDPAGRLHGPFNAMLLAPRAGQALQELGTAVRYGGALAPRAREIAILEVARGRRSNFEWLIHARAGARAGLSEEELDGLRTGEPIATLGADEAVVRDLVRSLVATRDVDDDLFARAESAIGAAAIVDVVILTGYYDLLALILAAARTPLPPGFEPAFE